MSYKRCLILRQNPHLIDTLPTKVVFDAIFVFGYFHLQEPYLFLTSNFSSSSHVWQNPHCVPLVYKVMSGYKFVVDQNHQFLIELISIAQTNDS